MEISRPVAEVLAFEADQTDAPQRQKGLHEVRRLTEGPIGAGTEQEFIRRSPVECSSEPTASQPFWSLCSAGFSPATRDGTTCASSDCWSAG